MATHLSILASRIPWTEGPGALQSMGLQRLLCSDAISKKTILFFFLFFWLCWVFIAVWAFLKWNYSLIEVHGLLIEVAFLIVVHGL